MSIGSSNISFSGLKTAYANSGGTGASGHSALNDGQTNTSISLSNFRGAALTDSSIIPSGSSSISINSHFKSKKFSSVSYTTNDFNFNDDFSGESDRLYPVSSASSTTAQTSSEHKFARLFHSNVTYDYPSILLCPQSGDPTIGTKIMLTVWIKLDLNGSSGQSFSNWYCS